MEKLVEDLHSLIKKSHLHEVSQGEERPINSTDFVFHIAMVNTTLAKIIHLLSDTQFNLVDSTLLCNKELLTDLFILRGENFEVSLWNNKEIVKQVLDIDRLVKDKLGYITDEDILVEDFKVNKLVLRPLLRPILLKLRPKLLKSSWKRNPGSVQAYIWLINAISFPHLGRFVQDVLPTALLLTDDFVNENRVMGVKCLTRIVNNITIAELKFHGYGQLIYKALEPLLRERDTDLATVTIPCIFTVVTKLETDFGDVDILQKWSRFDDVLEIILEVIEMEHLVDLRRVYISFMKYIIVTSGKRIIRWSKRILRLLDHYLEVSCRILDLSSIHDSLKALEEFLIVSELSQKYYLQDVTFILFRTFYNLNTSTTRTAEYEEVNSLCQVCIKLVFQRCSQKEKECILNSVESDLLNSGECPEFIKIKQLLS